MLVKELVMENFESLGFALPSVYICLSTMLIKTGQDTNILW